MTPQQQFITERRYLKSVTPATVIWYEQAFKRFDGALDSRAEVIGRIGELKERGLTPTSINCHLRVINAFMHWRDGQGDKCSSHCIHIHISRLKEEEKIIATLSAEQVARIVNRKPVGRNETRARMLALTALDTGMRLNELVCLKRVDVDFDNLLFRIVGKGNKHRLIPMSVELRKLLFRYLASHEYTPVFCTKQGAKLSPRNALRDFKGLCAKLHITGVRCSPHTLRHTFATSYLRSGGNLEFLRRILGHNSILTTQKYLKSLGVEDLKAVHSDLSLLSR